MSPEMVGAITALLTAIAALITALRARAAVARSSTLDVGRSGTVTRWEAPTGERSETEQQGASTEPTEPTEPTAPSPPGAPAGAGR